MKSVLDEISKLMDDPLFEIQHFGKEAIRQRIMPVNKYGERPAQLPFIDWTKEDDLEIIRYGMYDTFIGKLLIASTSKGICYIGFAHKGETEINADIRHRFPKQSIKEETNDIQLSALAYCNGNHAITIPLHVKGTGFQVSIWKQLVRIPEGKLSTYGSLAPNNGGAQAIGLAVGSNPVSYIIPCHRIVKAGRTVNGYYWGTDLKKLLLAYEFQRAK